MIKGGIIVSFGLGVSGLTRDAPDKVIPALRESANKNMYIGYGLVFVGYAHEILHTETATEDTIGQKPAIGCRVL